MLSFERESAVTQQGSNKAGNPFSGLTNCTQLFLVLALTVNNLVLLHLVLMKEIPARRGLELQFVSI